MKSTFTLNYEESGDRTLVFRYVPAPRGNKYRLANPGFATSDYLRVPELKDYIVQEVKPLYVAETVLLNYDHWTLHAQAYLLVPYKIKYHEVEQKINDLKDKTKVPVRLLTEHELEWSMFGGEDFLYPGCTNKEKVVKRYYLDKEPLRPNMFGLIDLLNHDMVCTSTLTKDRFSSQPIPSKVGDNVISRTPTFDLTQRWSDRKDDHFRIRLCIDADWVSRN